MDEPHLCVALSPEGECYRCDLERDMAELERDYEMFTDEGNQACQQIVERIKAEICSGVLTRNMLPERIQQLCVEVAQKHGEVWDTEPQANLADRINVLCTEHGWMEISRWDW